MPSSAVTNGFVHRYGAAFGHSKALLLRMAGLLTGEETAEGAWITDGAGRRLLDFGSFGVHLLGHRHPAATAAAADQLTRMGLSGKVLGNAAATECAEALIDVAPAGLDQVCFANTGAEAVEMAMKMAVLATGRDEFVALRGSYHGKTAGALNLSDTLTARSPLRLAARTHFVERGDSAALDALLGTGRVAAVFAEPVQGEGGIHPVPQEFLDQVRESCTRHGTLMALDEIQTGLGRCGRLWRSADRSPPDLLLTGKVLGGGLVPIAACSYASRKIGAGSTDPVALASSFAGGAVAARVATAVLGIVRQQSFLDRVTALGERTRAGLRDMPGADGRIAGIRGEGLMIGLQASSASVAGHLVLEAAKRGVLLSFCLSDPTVLRIYPPAVISEDDLAWGLARIAEAVAACPLNE